MKLIAKEECLPDSLRMRTLIDLLLWKQNKTYGRWNKAGARIVRKTIHALAAAKHISKSAASIRVNQRLSCALWRNNARAVLDRLPELCDLQAPLEE